MAQDPHRISDLFLVAARLAPEEQAAYLEKECGEDLKLRGAVEKLLKQQPPESFLGPLAMTPLRGGEGDPGVHLEDSEIGDGQGIHRIVGRLALHAPKESRYQVLGELARGGMGAILEAYDLDLRRHLAMKTIRDTEQLVADPRTVGRFLEEAQVTGQLNHPGIVPVHELGIDKDGQIYFTMQLVKGNTFKDLIDWVWEGKEGWNQTRALSVLLDVCDTLAYAHSRGVIHRDIKPANIMVGKFGETYVMDWGVARVLGAEDQHDLRLQIEPAVFAKSIESDRREARELDFDSPLVTMDGMVVGTPAYIPPEQALGKVKEVDARSDAYSVGAMLYHLLTGQMPYVPKNTRPSPRAVLLAVTQGPPKPVHVLNPAVPVELVAIGEKAMSRQRVERYANTREMAEDLRAYLENRVVKAHRIGALVELRKWVQRNQPLAAAMGILLVVLLSGAAIVYFKNQQLTDSNQALSLSRNQIRSQKVELEHQKSDLEEQHEELQEQSSRIRQANLELTAARLVAEQNESLAVEEREAADAERDNVLRLSDTKRLRDLRERSEGLWPVHPDLVSDLEDWLAQSKAITANVENHRSSLAQVRGRSPSADGVRDPGEVAFTSGEDAWWYETLYGLVADLTAFSDIGNADSPVASVHDRLERSRTIERRSVLDHLEEWEDTALFLAESETYHHLEIEPQMGLVPLGENQGSGLWEFWVVEAGERPERDPDTEEWVIKPETGIVLVLLPGGTFTMGATQDPQGRNYDPQARSDEKPMEVSLSPFFLSRYEMTQGQWLRLMQTSPSRFGSEDAWTLSNWAQHPVEQVDWYQCKEALRRLGLVLPTEAQWEYGARAETDTPWWTGRQEGDLETVANLADQRWERSFAASIKAHTWDDGYQVHAPVGSFPCNGFGLYDTMGNVWEWCQDAYVADPPPARVGDGLRAEQAREGTFLRVSRGGGFSFTAFRARSATRGGNAPVYLSGNVGMRPARSLDR
jgi:formylglycine-generating enzyme required for sulfatase activity/serine/threonine protein kinase